ncbi:hypothetical protein SPLC1_S041180 [Arthrospira platensis C1]|nr:hypothetical protein SPLC1_S041180 [Arthrospira platensis C1]
MNKPALPHRGISFGGGNSIMRVWGVGGGIAGVVKF